MTYDIMIAQRDGRALYTRTLQGSDVLSLAIGSISWDENQMYLVINGSPHMPMLIPDGEEFTVSVRKLPEPPIASPYEWASRQI